MGALLDLFDENKLAIVIDKLCSQKPLYLKRQFIDKNRVLKYKTQIIDTIHHSIHIGSYQHQPVKKVEIMDGQKKRIIYKLDFIDRVVAGAIYNIISALIDPYYPETLYSYRRGKSRFQALKAFTDYIALHKSEVKDVKKMGFYVLRLDIKKYGESIPVKDKAYIWTFLEGIFGNDKYNLGFDNDDLELLNKFIRPQIIGNDATSYNEYGIIDGSPISALLLNLYLQEVDELFSNVKGGFYARFGDDILFAHPNYKTLIKSDKEFIAKLGKIGLEFNEKKKQIIYFNGAGKATDDNITSAERIEFLGLDNNFNGLHELTKTKTKSFFKEISSRIENINYSLMEKDVNEKASAICNMANQALDPRSEFQLKELSNIAFVNSKKQLMMFDYFIARKIANILANNNSVKSFRNFNYKTMRREWGLKSLAHEFRKNFYE